MKTVLFKGIFLLLFTLFYNLKGTSQVLDPGTISYSGGMITYGTNTANFPETAPSGGTGGYGYLWEYSLDGLTWSVAPAGFGINYSASGLTKTTYFRRWVVSGLQWAVSNIIQVPVAPVLSPGTFTYNGGSIDPGTDPGNIFVSGTNGGNCSGNYQYQLLHSTDGGASWGNASGMQSTSSFDPGPLSVTTLFKVAVSCGSEFFFTNPVTVNVNPPLVPGGVNFPPVQIGYGEDPGFIPNTLPSGGTGSYTYQWQMSTDNGNTWSNIPGATTPDYDPGPVNVSFYYRRIVDSGGQEAITGPTLVAFYDNLKPGILSYGGGPLGLGVDPGNVPEVGPTAPDCNYIPSIQWQYSLDGTTWMNVPNNGNLDPMHDGLHENYDPGPVTQFMSLRRQVSCAGHVAFTNVIRLPLIPLSVTFISFTAVRMDKNILLEWTTAKEINIKDFIIERSTDGVHFSEIGHKNPSGNSSFQQYYSFSDTGSSAGPLFYRIKEIDNDGKFLISSIQKVWGTDVNIDSNVYPDPFTEYFTISILSANDQPVMFRLYNYLGEMVLKQQHMIGKGQNYIRIAPLTLPPGMYSLQVQSANGTKYFKMIRK